MTESRKGTDLWRYGDISLNIKAELVRGSERYAVPGYPCNELRRLPPVVE